MSISFQDAVNEYNIHKERSAFIRGYSLAQEHKVAMVKLHYIRQHGRPPYLDYETIKRVLDAAGVKYEE